MEEQQRAQFISAYTRVLTAAWSDEEYASLLTRDPAEALRSQGLEVPAGAKVTVTRQIPADAGEPSIDIAIGKWEAGKVSGVYVLSVPEEPVLGTEELSEAELASVAAGISVSCCSCPCSCCS